MIGLWEFKKCRGNTVYTLDAALAFFEPDQVDPRWANINKPKLCQYATYTDEIMCGHHI